MTEHRLCDGPARLFDDSYLEVMSMFMVCAPPRHISFK